jgi:hypothetical protein
VIWPVVVLMVGLVIGFAAGFVEIRRFKRGYRDRVLPVSIVGSTVGLSLIVVGALWLAVEVVLRLK